MSDVIKLAGDQAPSFILKDQDGDEINLEELGKDEWVVLYFYPKDDTSGCTLEAKDFTCMMDDFKKEGAIIVGISPDSVQSHMKFAGKHGLNLTLLSDPEKESIKAYGVWKKKKRYGREFMGVERSTFLIGPDGKIKKEWRKVKVKGHAKEILTYLKDRT